jgi:glycosyltransferase involved in cell wall biosynthesis
MLHVLTISPFYPTQGDDAAGCFVAEPLAALCQREVRHSVIAAQPLYRQSEQAGRNAPPAEAIRYFSFPKGAGLPTAGFFLYRKLLAKVRELHQQEPLDLIHAHSALPCGHAALLMARELKIPFVVSVHGLDAFFTKQVKGWLGNWCRRTAREIYHRANRVICVSERVAETVRAGTSADCRISVVYNGVNPVLFAPGGEPKAAPLILSVGNLIPIKGHELLLRALARNQSAAFVCDVIGDGPERPRLELLAHELGLGDRVRFLGRRSRAEVAQAMQRCTLFVLPSRYEALGCVYLEAMSAAKPVVACREQGIEEIIEHGVNGWLVGPDHADELSEAILRLLADAELRNQLGQAARATIVQAHSLDHQATQLSAVYQECVA